MMIHDLLSPGIYKTVRHKHTAMTCWHPEKKCWQPESVWNLQVEDKAQETPPEVTPTGEQVA